MLRRIALLSALLMGGSGFVWGQAQFLRVDDANWEFSGDVQRGTTLGQKALQLRSGVAVRRDAALLDGVIEFDVAVTSYRSFVYLRFRMQDDREYEEIYFRPHKSMLPDAVQYSPVYQGVSNWQLYHGPGRTAAVDLPPDRWIHVRLVLSGARAALFVGKAESPQLVIPLEREPKVGYVSVRAFLPAGVDAKQPIAHFANLTVHPGHVPKEVNFDVAPTGAVPGVVREWRISQPFAPPEGAVRELPEDVLKGEWRTLATDSSGLLVLYRHVKRLQDTRRPAVLARLTIDAEQPGLRRLNLGYSDEVTVYLNGPPLFYADDSYSFDNPRRQGLIGLHQATLFLPLQEGENDLILAVADSFGGWGLMAQLEE